MESMLNEFGRIIEWKRNKDEKGNSVSFGIAEFASVEGLINAVWLHEWISPIFKKLKMKIGEKNK